MVDVHDPETRSYNMSQIKAKDTKPEMWVRKFLHSNGLRYRLHVKNLLGKPDIVLTRYNTIVEVNGCLFHGHYPCPDFKLPGVSTNSIRTVNKWASKILKNKIRDIKKYQEWLDLGWRVTVVWECTINTISKRKVHLPLLLDYILEKEKK